MVRDELMLDDVYDPPRYWCGACGERCEPVSDSPFAPGTREDRQWPAHFESACCGAEVIDHEPDYEDERNPDAWGGGFADNH